MKAFPYVREIDSPKEGYTAYVHEDGMDLRDYFASDAMKGDFASGIHEDDFEECAKRAYKMADAMMKARAK